MVVYGPYGPVIQRWINGLRTSYSSLLQNRWGDLVLTRIFPAYFFTLVLVAKALGLVTRLQDGSRETAFLVLSSYVLQQVLAMVFLAIVVVLFVVRRPVVGRRSTVRGAIVAIAGTFILTLAASARVDEGNVAALLLSSGLVLTGTGLSIASLVVLGRCFGMMPEARGLVRRGPYRWIRHPIYLGEMVSALGLVVAATSVFILLLFAAFCAVQYWRAVLEEHALEEAFPEYADYRRRTYRLLPGLH